MTDLKAVTIYRPKGDELPAMKFSEVKFKEEQIGVTKEGFRIYATYPHGDHRLRRPDTTTAAAGEEKAGRPTSSRAPTIGRKQDDARECRQGTRIWQRRHRRTRSHHRWRLRRKSQANHRLRRSHPRRVPPRRRPWFIRSLTNRRFPPSAMIRSRTRDRGNVKSQNRHWTHRIRAAFAIDRSAVTDRTIHHAVVRTAVSVNSITHAPTSVTATIHEAEVTVSPPRVTVSRAQASVNRSPYHRTFPAKGPTKRMERNRKRSAQFKERCKKEATEELEAQAPPPRERRLRVEDGQVVVLVLIIYAFVVISFHSTVSWSHWDCPHLLFSCYSKTPPYNCYVTLPGSLSFHPSSLWSKDLERGAVRSRQGLPPMNTVMCAPTTTAHIQTTRACALHIRSTDSAPNLSI